ncbi:DUF3489 domain-containing protein [Pseudotabrizicola sediminis]|nr:DUF3489 domain-containing protein [Pseudotabrizicola sediminis]
MTKAKTPMILDAVAHADVANSPSTLPTKSHRTSAKPAAEGPAFRHMTQSEPISALLPRQPRQTKAALLRARLAEPGGVSLAALIEATGWQAHTLRAALSGLRKTGLKIACHREGDDTIYAIDAEATIAAQPSDRPYSNGVDPDPAATLVVAEAAACPVANRAPVIRADT